MTTIAIIVPVLGRPDQAQPLVDSIRAAERVPTTIVFVCSPGDVDQQGACVGTGERVVVTAWDGGQGDYARKINYGIEITTDDWIFTGADDLRFANGWDVEALHAARRGAGVVGTRDGCNPRTRQARHSTHSLVARWYAVEHGTVDDRPAIYHEGYWHNFCDDEMVSTAIARRSYAPSTAFVEHLHPMRRDGNVQMDDTYRLGVKHFHDDRRTFRSRRTRWSRARLAQERSAE